MPLIPLHPPHPHRTPPAPNPSTLPQLLHTPSGLAILELQGTINIPPICLSGPSDPKNGTATHVGRIVFCNDGKEGKEGQRVYLYVGKYQRLTGEVKRLGMPLGVLRRRRDGLGRLEGGERMDGVEGGGVEEGGGGGEELEIVEVARWKVIFSSRPEPVGADGGGD